MEFRTNIEGRDHVSLVHCHVSSTALACSRSSVNILCISEGTKLNPRKLNMIKTIVVLIQKMKGPSRHFPLKFPNTKYIKFLK